MPDRVVLLTGGTGSLGRELVRELLRDPGVIVYALTRDPAGTRACALLDMDRAARPARLRLVDGDVTRAGLGMTRDDADVLRRTLTHVVHVAADTSFTAPLDRARTANVAGTRNVLTFARACERLAAVACASTVYVAGRRTGLILERDAAAPDGWVNTYEQSKHEMEAVVRSAMEALPVSLYRLSTIVGHSETGEVTGFNAIHHAMRLFYQGLAPMLPGELSTPVDLIPVDFAARALGALVTRAFRPGETYHLAAGRARSCTLDELLGETVAVFNRTRPAWRRRRIERPAVVDADTYALFVRSVEESGNVVLQQATRAVQAFAWQLAYPKDFATGRTDAALTPFSISALHVRDFYGRVVEHCVHTSWGRSTAAGAVA